MSDHENPPAEIIVHHYLRIYKKNHFINYQLFLSDDFGRQVSNMRDFKFGSAVYHVIAGYPNFSDEQLAAAVFDYQQTFVAPLLENYPKKTDGRYSK